MTTWLLESELSVLLFVLLLPITAAPFLAVVYRRYHHTDAALTTLAAASGLYVCALLAFTTFPLPSPGTYSCDGRELSDYWRLDPWTSFSFLVDYAQAHGPIATLTSAVFLQVVFNVVFFVPLGFLLAYWARRSFPVTVLAGLSVSLLIEATQGSALWGLYPCPYRLADGEDLVTNTLGAALGWALGVLVARRLPLRHPDDRDDTAPPTVRRRLIAATVDAVIGAALATGIEIADLVANLHHGDLPSDLVLRLIPVVVGLVLYVGIPLLRSDRATIGQLTVLIGPCRPTGEPAPAWSVLVRFLLRWSWVVVFGLEGLLGVAAVELVVVAIRKDRRSLAALASRTVSRTRSSTG